MEIVNRKQWLALILAAALAALMLFSACGGGDDDDSADDDDNGPTATQAADGDDDSGDDDEEPTATEDSGGDDGDDDDDNGDGVDACALLTPEEIEGAIGVAVPEGENQDIEQFYDCSWISEQFDSVSLSVTSREFGEALYDLDLDESTDPEDVDGLGDRAHYLAGLLPILEILDGDYYVSISVNSIGLDEDGKREAALELGELVLDRLP